MMTVLDHMESLEGRSAQLAAFLGELETVLSDLLLPAPPRADPAKEVKAGGDPSSHLGTRLSHLDYSLQDRCLKVEELVCRLDLPQVNQGALRG